MRRAVGRARFAGRVQLAHVRRHHAHGARCGAVLQARVCYRSGSAQVNPICLAVFEYVQITIAVYRADGLGESYNPTLLNVAGPWDRGYGFCMTQYFASIGPPIAAVTGLDVPCE
jgi:hypothetical protein